MNVGIILAGGTGTRIGANIPKQFIEIQGKPILAYTLEIFQNDEKIDAIEVVCHKDWVDEVKRITDTYGISKLRWLSIGGITFQESTMNGIFNLKGKIAADDIAVISFGVSPMTTADIIDDSIRVCEEHGNAIASEDIVLCTCIKDDEYSTTQNLIRENIKGFSNPWAFKFGELCEAYETAVEKEMLDDLEPHTTSLYLALGKRLWFSKSTSTNIKITTPEDLDIFEGHLLLKEKRRKEATETEIDIANEMMKSE
ncbi:MAG: 2-C-methyl-D-erythritol 4-phosphate cytidylyltransferase [Clostridiales bacterium]|nr:2-C-methyl-D-erythritol 4-phosphate cytidylyltransferase [Clostridiales bacterium]